MKKETKDAKIAMLIDCDNVGADSIEGILNELSKYGTVNIRNAYGNWKSRGLSGWEKKLHEFAIKPIQQFDYTKGKNATDIAMVIDTMDLLYTRELDAFALITSDSDFTPVVARILSNGLTVYGFGEKKTPKPFVTACSQFIYTENLEQMDEETHEPKKPKRRTKQELRMDTWLVNLLRNATEQTADEDGYSNLASVGIYIANNSSFSPINYGYKKLGEIIREIDLFHIDKGEGNLYIKDKRT